MVKSECDLWMVDIAGDNKPIWMQAEEREENKVSVCLIHSTLNLLPLEEAVLKENE